MFMMYPDKQQNSQVEAAMIALAGIYGPVRKTTATRYAPPLPGCIVPETSTYINNVIYKSDL